MDALLFPEEQVLKPNIQKKTGRILSVFEQIHNHIYANEGLSSEQVFSEMIKIISFKICDEKHRLNLFRVLPEEVSGASHSNLSDFQKRMERLYDEVLKYWPNDLTDNIALNLSSKILVFVVDKLQHISLMDSSRDVKGLAFQKFVSAEHRRGRGQFFTPEQVVDLCVKILRPTPDDRILDPACGTGGFLSLAHRFILDNYNVNSTGKNLFGIDINSLIARVAKVRLALEEAEDAQLFCINGLDDWDHIDHALNSRSQSLGTFEEGFDIILTNPPFGSQGKIKEKSFLKRYDLGHKWKSLGDTFVKTETIQGGQVPDILFIERCLDFLKPGGRMAIVLPNGDLENLSLRYLRKYVKDRAELLAVLLLPSDTFIPFGTGVKASILFLQKKPISNKVNPNVFFGEIQKLGYTANKTGSIIYKRTDKGEYSIDSEGNPIVDEDISMIVSSFDLFEKTGKLPKESTNCFLVKRKSINDRFDCEFYHPEHRELQEKLLRHKTFQLGEVVKIVKRKMELRSDDGKVEYVELSDINTDYCEISRSEELFVHDLPSRASYKLKEGDILTAVAGNAIGTSKHMSALVTSEFDGAICSNGFRILRPKNGDIDPLYLLFFLRTNIYFKQVFRYRTGAAIPAISDSDLKKILIPIPEKEEQSKIASIVNKGFEARRDSKNGLKCITKEFVSSII